LLAKNSVFCVQVYGFTTDLIIKKSSLIYLQRKIIKKLINLLFVISICFVGCSNQGINNSDERSNIINWAKQIAKFERDSIIVMDEFNSLTIDISSHYPSDEELSQLTNCYNLITYMYNKLSEMNPPPNALSVHLNYVENYSKASDTILFYIIAVKQNDISYFEKSVAASKEGNRIGDEAYNGFADLLSKYSISCNETDYCE